MKYYNSKARQAGMTLIELTVVLLVLIGLAGLMIPYVTGFISKTHDSTGDSNISALNNAIFRFESQYGSFPDDLQLLAYASGTTPELYAKLLPGANGALHATKYASGSSPDDTVLKSLSDAGMTRFLNINSAANNGTASATFAVASTEENISKSTFSELYMTVVDLGAKNNGTAYNTIEEHLADAFGMRPEQFNAVCYDYIVVGIGQEAQLTGKTISDAPVHFAQNAKMGPSKRYNRFIAVFQVDKDDNGSQTAPANVNIGGNSNNKSVPTIWNGKTVDCGANTEKAKFIGTGMLMKPKHLWGLAHSLGHSYDNLAADAID